MKFMTKIWQMNFINNENRYLERSITPYFFRDLLGTITKWEKI